MEIFGNKIKQKISNKYCCYICDYVTDRKSNINNHFNSAKHIKEINGNKIKQIKQFLSNNFECDVCNKIYKTNAGLWKHKKICKQINNTEIKKDEIKQEEITNKDELIMLLVKQNTELMEMLKNGTNNITNYNNSNNKTFNLQFFLNETCKDAMNINDFIDSIKLQVTDLERVGEIGYIDGISNIITKNLKALDVTRRPIHCTDKKREVLYIKDENKWEKEDEQKKKMRKLIKRVSDKNINLISKFKEIHPDCGKSVSKYSDQYNKIIIESMGGIGDNNDEKEDKIIKNITKTITIDKEIDV
jgi:hypothetical protein